MPPAPTPYRYLNAGGFMGRAGDLMSVLMDVEKDIGLPLTMSLEWPERASGLDDQELLFSYYIRHKDRSPHFASLDYYQELFAVYYRTDHAQLDTVGGRLHNPETFTFPLILHGKIAGCPVIAVDRASAMVITYTIPQCHLSAPGRTVNQAVFYKLAAGGLNTTVIACAPFCRGSSSSVFSAAIAY